MSYGNPDKGLGVLGLLGIMIFIWLMAHNGS